ncbi:Nitrogenase (molybdenum-iron)-specific transcriptional regulator NifA [Arcticibacter svalbardensis MN12-7]|uniref:Nitrogenase (Molybdenum-iron)-specific transcriptional regulator NifA n=1 Tax=Arcticibacter svalbardensis MN12-7 TaxID=1150600 RepID=R9GRD3_9SPHI|nr:sigma 54-interacting transcriptional regulator [Arcticibacter svalbardensis]EOR94271.1 Nitrogenase (molybdenum-iron)-specific transcriptional regulator NifA [Arcticibacter svalbardensis MN12-7]
MLSCCVRNGRDCYGQSELPLLFGISTLLNGSVDIKDVLYPILELMNKYISAKRSMITILNRDQSTIYIEDGYGITAAAKAKGVYRIGEGITGLVVKTGCSITIPDISKESRFLNKTGYDLMKNRGVSFICVPIKVDEQSVGTISIFRLKNDHFSVVQDVETLSIVGSLIAQAVKVRQDQLEELVRLKSENQKLSIELKGFKRPANIIGSSRRMQEVYQLVSTVAPTNATVLIRGESGVGKELIAEAIHYASNRANMPFIKVNCSALPENLIESELFGHEKGSFTGAASQRKGRFELADHGTIFLDEIGDLPTIIQVKLLRVIQQREFDRVGGTKTIKTDVRIIAATNRNLEELIKQNLFREDLYYRINVFPMHIPSLRERKTDITTLADHFIEKFNNMNNASVKRISSDAIDLLMIYSWPGNIRELENCIERACILSVSGVINSENLPPTLQTAESSHTERKGPLLNVLDGVEKQMIIDTLTSTRGNIVKAAEIMGITERIIGLRIKKYSISTRIYKGLRNQKNNENE